MKKIIMAVVALVMLGGGGGGAYMYFMGGEAVAASVEAEAGAQAEAGHGSSGGSHGEENHFEYVEMDPLVLPIIDEYGVSQVISLVVSIEVIDAEAAEKINKMKPRLKDAYIQDMYGLLNRQTAMNNGVVQVDKIKERLNKVSTKVMGDDVVHDVLLQVVNQRPI